MQCGQVALPSGRRPTAPGGLSALPAVSGRSTVRPSGAEARAPSWFVLSVAFSADPGLAQKPSVRAVSSNDLLIAASYGLNVCVPANPHFEAGTPGDGISRQAFGGDWAW